MVPSSSGPTPAAFPTSLESPGNSRVGKRKLAEVIAERIEQDIAGGGFVEGDVVGSEADLMARYGVSRAVLREAIRIVEHHFVAAMRRGPGGGLVVTAPDIGAIVRAVTLQLHYQAIDAEQLFEARTALELGCVREAAERIDVGGVARMEGFLAEQATLAPGEFMGHSHEFHALVADLTQNPALRLFVEILGHLTEAQSRDATPEETNAVRRAHLRIAQAIIAGDADAAERRMKRHLVEVTGWLEEPHQEPARSKTPRPPAKSRAPR